MEAIAAYNDSESGSEEDDVTQSSEDHIVYLKSGTSVDRLKRKVRLDIAPAVVSKVSNITDTEIM